MISSDAYRRRVSSRHAVLELGEQPVELVQADGVRHAGDLLGAEVDEQLARNDDGNLALPQVPQASDVVRVGEHRSVNDHLAGVEVFVNGGTPVHATPGAVESQPSRHDQLLSPGF